jgi:hypothetical protein
MTMHGLANAQKVCKRLASKKGFHTIPLLTDCLPSPPVGSLITLLPSVTSLDDQLLFFVEIADSIFLPEGVRIVPECMTSDYRKIIFFHCRNYLAGIDTE